MAKTRAWFEGELRRMLGFDEVEEIARFALDSFPVSQPVELRQYLEQFLGQSRGVEKLCDELSARRKGDAPAPTTASSSSSSSSSTGVTANDFWGVTGGGGGAAGAAGGPNRRGKQGGKSPLTAEGGNNNNNSNRGKGRGKVYQKAAVEEDFWGGGTTSGRAKSASAPSAAAPGGRKNDTGKRGPASAAAAVVAARAPAAAAPAAAAANVRKAGGATGTATKGGVGGGRVSSKQPLASAPPAAAAGAAATKPSGGGGGAKTTALPATPPAPAPVPEWSGVTCLCMGKTHDVVTNCMDCGKIACVKEGGFGCSFCGCRLPTTGREPRSAASGGVDGAAGAAAPQSAALKEALERKDRLLLFDRTSASRTRVLDDQGDYFTSHNWLSQREREKGEAEEKARRDDAASRRGARRQVKMSIDIMGRRVIETQDPGEGRADGGGGEGEADDDASKKTQGVSLDFGSSSAAGGGAVGTSAGAAAAGSIAEEADTPGAGNGNQRLSLENTGLRGRAKEVYDVMRANLDKKSRRRRPGGAGGKAVAGSRIVGAVPETSRVNLWRVQHDVDSDDLLRQSQASGGGGGGGAGDGGGFGKFEPADELACAR